MDPIRRLTALLGLRDSTSAEEFQEPDFLNDDYQILSSTQRAELDELSDHVQEDVPDHPKPAPGNKWADVENRVTDCGFTQLGVGHDRVVYQLPYDGLEDKIVKFARETAISRTGYRGAAQNAAEVGVYWELFNNHREALSYFNTVYSMDKRSETFRWLVMDVADPAEDMYHVEGLEEEFGIRPINPEVGYVNGKPVYIDYGEGFQVLNSDGQAVDSRGTYYGVAKGERARDRSGLGG